jgi:ADP-heptose:LPS heptosyltransferase
LNPGHQLAPVIVSPFANERVRQWPARHFHELIKAILSEHALPVMVVGTREQRASANDIVRGLSSEQVSNTCGTLRWSELVQAIDEAPYVVGNNSGIVHLAAARGRWTLCIFSGSHAYNEWMPRGPFVVTIVKALLCSPCGSGDERCPNDVACMAELPPLEVFRRFEQARALLSRVGPGGADLTSDRDPLRVS